MKRKSLWLMGLGAAAAAVGWLWWARRGAAPSGGSGTRGIAAFTPAERDAPAEPAVAQLRFPAVLVPERRTIGVDLDEVLGQFVAPMAAFHDREYGTDIPAADYFSYNFADVWGCSYEEAEQRVRHFFRSEEFADLPLVEGAEEAIRGLSQHFNLAVVTSRQHIIRDITITWLDEHFPNCFFDCLFGNHWASTGAKRSKSDMCADIGAFVLIDDSFKYALELSKTLQLVVLFDHDLSYGWSRSDDALPSNVKRLPDWPSTCEAVYALDTEDQ